MSQSEVARREDRVRRKARTLGLVVRKSRYRLSELKAARGGFMLVDEGSNTIVAGAHPSAFSLTLDELEAELAGRGR